jgi:hypothetical protein
MSKKHEHQVFEGDLDHLHFEWSCRPNDQHNSDYFLFCPLCKYETYMMTTGLAFELPGNHPLVLSFTFVCPQCENKFTYDNDTCTIYLDQAASVTLRGTKFIVILADKQQ